MLMWPWYQDFEANHKFLYSRASDVFAAGCTIYKMITSNELLLVPTYKYVANQVGTHDARMFYANILQTGRPRSNGNSVESIIDRSGSTFCKDLLPKMVAVFRKTRVTAEDALNLKSFKQLQIKQKLNLEKMSEGKNKSNIGLFDAKRMLILPSY